MYCGKLSFCQNDPAMGESFWQKESLLQYTMTLLQGPKDPVLLTLIYIKVSILDIHDSNAISEEEFSYLPGSQVEDTTRG